MRLLNIDDHGLFRKGLRYLLRDLDPDLEFFESGTSTTLDSIPDEIDLILLDYCLPGEGGLEALDRIRTKFPESQVVIISGQEDPTAVRECIKAGASGYILKQSEPPLLISALRLVLAGGIYLPLIILDSAIASEYGVREKSKDRTNRLAGLQPRQLEALKMAVKGKSNKTIARALELSEGSVKQYLSTAYRVLGVQNRTGAVIAFGEHDMNRL